jgi:hypothetical protein
LAAAFAFHDITSLPIAKQYNRKVFECSDQALDKFLWRYARKSHFKTIHAELLILPENVKDLLC